MAHDNPAAGIRSQGGPTMSEGWEAGHTLGKGNDGTVKLYIDRKTQMKVAAKFNEGLIFGSAKAKRAHMEIKVLRMLRHPHVVELYDVFEGPGRLVIILEYLPMGDLCEYLETHGCPSEFVSRTIFQEVLSAVDWCHKHGVIHHDIKASNILLDGMCRVKLVDFGLSSIVEAPGKPLLIFGGTRGYRAPELYIARPYAGPPVDIWSCGIVLYALLCGYLPFPVVKFDPEGNDPSLQKTTNLALPHGSPKGLQTPSSPAIPHPLDIPSYLSPQATQILRSMIERDPSRRATISMIKKTEWFQSHIPPYIAYLMADHPAENVSISSPPPPPPPPPPPSSAPPETSPYDLRRSSGRPGSFVAMGKAAKVPNPPWKRASSQDTKFRPWTAQGGEERLLPGWAPLGWSHGMREYIDPLVARKLCDVIRSEMSISDWDVVSAEDPSRLGGLGVENEVWNGLLRGNVGTVFAYRVCRERERAAQGRIEGFGEGPAGHVRVDSPMIHLRGSTKREEDDGEIR